MLKCLSAIGKDCAWLNGAKRDEDDVGELDSGCWLWSSNTDVLERFRGGWSSEGEDREAETPWTKSILSNFKRLESDDYGLSSLDMLRMMKNDFDCFNHLILLGIPFEHNPPFDLKLKETEELIKCPGSVQEKLSILA